MSITLFRTLIRTSLAIKDAESFSDFNLSPVTQKAIDLMGFQSPTLIQKKSIPAGIQGWDIIGKAKTGSGKSIGFLVTTLSL